MSYSKTLEFTSVARYLTIAQNAYNKVQLLVKKRAMEIDKENQSVAKVIKLSFDIQNEAIITVVFSAMTLEAFINECGIKCSTKSFFDDNLDQLNVISKFLIIPKLYKKTELETDKQQFENLIWLVKLRNDLVHFKFKKVSLQDVESSLQAPINKQKLILHEAHAKKAINTLKEVIKALDEDSLKKLEKTVRSFKYFKLTKPFNFLK